MHTHVDFCVVPMGESISVSKYVAECQRILEQCGFQPQMHPYGTNIEGEWTEVFAAIGKCHEKLHKMGVERISTSVRCGTRTDRTQSLADKVNSVNEILK